MNIIVICKMGPGTIEAKLEPLSKLKEIEKIYVLRELPGPNIEKVEYILFPNYIKIVKVLKIIIPIYLAFYAKKHKCHLIIGYHFVPHVFFAYFASLLSGIPFVGGQTGLIIQRQSKNYFLNIFLKCVFSKMLFLNVPGKMSKQFWINFGMNPSKINILHSTIDTSRFCNTNNKKEFDFIIVSRLSKEKRIEKIINIFGLLKSENYKFKVCIVGDGAERKFLETLSSNLNLNDSISFVGFKSNPELWFNKSNCYLLSSETDAFPTALMQAMACELICIVTNVGNISDTIINNKNGFIVDYGDWELYKNIILRILTSKDSGDFDEIKKNARQSALAFHSYETAERKWKELINQSKLILK